MCTWVARRAPHSAVAGQPLCARPGYQIAALKHKGDRLSQRQKVCDRENELCASPRPGRALPDGLELDLAIGAQPELALSRLWQCPVSGSLVCRFNGAIMLVWLMLTSQRDRRHGRGCRPAAGHRAAAPDLCQRRAGGFRRRGRHADLEGSACTPQDRPPPRLDQDPRPPLAVARRRHGPADGSLCPPRKR